MHRSNELTQKESPWTLKEHSNDTGFWGCR